MDTSSLPGLSPLQCRKRSAILDGAKTVFLREGFGLATMDDVASAAGVGKQTVYRHFKSKEALFVGLVSAMCAQVGAAACQRSGRAIRWRTRSRVARVGMGAGTKPYYAG